jgi:hypothetical protein
MAAHPTESEDTSRRVKAALIYLADVDTTSGTDESPAL